MLKKVGVVHTITNSIEDINSLFRTMLPDVEQINIIDDSIVREIVRNVDATPAIIARLGTYYQICEKLGCVCILNECTSVAFAADIAEKTVGLPVFRIDYPMARKAAAIGRRIGVIATAVSTVKPSLATFQRAAAEEGRKDAEIKMYFCEGAHSALFNDGDRSKHDAIVTEVVKKAAEENDVLALAQGSMASLADNFSDLGIPVLTSLESGVAQIKEYLKTLG